MIYFIENNQLLKFDKIIILIKGKYNIKIIKTTINENLVFNYTL